MKYLLKSLFIAAISFHLVYTYIPAIDFGKDPQNLLIFIGGLFIISQLLHPIFTIILLPVNILTQGIASLLLNVLLVFGLIKFIPGFSVSPYSFTGVDLEGLVIPQKDFSQISTIILIAVAITIVERTLQKVFE